LFLFMKRKLLITLPILLVMLVTACAPSLQPTMILPTEELAADEEVSLPDITPFPTRPAYAPGELVDYIAQTGDTLPALAARFNTTELAIREANPIIPEDATTMPPGMPMQIPIYFRPLWGTPYQIIADAHFVNGPALVDFRTQAFIWQHQGWLRNYEAWAFNGTRTAGEIVDYVAVNYSISPKLLLALLEYQAGCFTEPDITEVEEKNLLGLESSYWTGVYLQLSYAANLLNDGYYRFREGDLLELELADGSLVRPDPWQNAATVALQYFFSRVLDAEAFHRAIGPDGFAATYGRLFGDPWMVEAHIPGSLKQPEMQLPFSMDTTWAFTGGPHTAWGSLSPWAALDFAPPSDSGGCSPTSEYTTAVADGVVVRDGPGVLVLDLDGDGDERTGWVVFYLHIAEKDRVPVGTVVNQGDPLGYPSCEGGRSTGTHIHIARKYNGEWMVADGPIPFVLSGWRPVRGDSPYEGWLVRDDVMVVANINPDNHSAIPID
jgi:murein DD-endopeptidase MepM/ murein hydrolase activator NlpD